MLELSALTLFGMLLSLLYGWELEYSAARLLKLEGEPEVHFPLTILEGLALLSGLLGVWSFYWGISTRALLFFTILALAAGLLIWKYIFRRIRALARQVKSLGLAASLAAILLSLYAFYLAAAADLTADTGLYHAQAIRWIEFYRAVPGLANLHTRLGFNSSIFLLAAFWGLVGFGKHLYQIPGLVIVLASMFHCLILLKNSTQGFRLSGLAALGMIVYLIFGQHVLFWLASPTTDLPAMVITWSIILLAMEVIESGAGSITSFGAITLIVLGSFDLSIKLSAAPILLIPIALLWRDRRPLTWKATLAAGVPGAVILLPWLARNAALTGYLFFPFDKPDIFRFDWKVPRETVENLASVIQSWGRVPYMGSEAVKSMTLGQWLPAWFQTLSPYDLFLFEALLIGLVVFAAWVVIARRTAGWLRPYTALYLICAIGLVFWFAASPAPRFGYGFLVPMLCLFYAPALISLTGLAEKYGRQISIGLQVLFTISVLVVLVQIPFSSWRHYLGDIKSYPVIETRTVRVDAQAISIPINGGQCWYAAFPCAPSIDPGLTLRGPDLQDGFSITQK